MLTEKKKDKPVFRRIVEFLHLWLGLITGIVVFVVCLTAAIWVLRDEIYYFTMPENRIAKQEGKYLPPSELLKKGKEYLKARGDDTSHTDIRLITYHKPGSAINLEYELTNGDYRVMLLNPYTGQVTYSAPGESKTDQFMLFVRAGHRFFWLPQKIGSLFVGSSCLVFLVILITGIIWWYPRKWNASTRKKSFAIKWNAKWKRLNIDLHNVLGFYSFLVVIILTITGITFTFSWFNNGYHKMLTGKPYEEQSWHVPSDTTAGIQAVNKKEAADFLWNQYAGAIDAGNASVNIFFPEDSIESWVVTVTAIASRTSDMPTYFHDQYSLKLLRQSKDYNKLSAGEKLYEMTFDIHVATIWGLPSKIIASLSSLIAASLPVTGFIIWYNRKFGRKKKKRVNGGIARDAAS